MVGVLSGWRNRGALSAEFSAVSVDSTEGVCDSSELLPCGLAWFASDVVRSIASPSFPDDLRHLGIELLTFIVGVPAVVLGSSV